MKYYCRLRSLNMMYQLIIYLPVFLIIKTTCHVAKNDTNVVIYGGHADVADYVAPRRTPSTSAPKLVTQRVVQYTTSVVQHVQQRAEEYDDKVSQ